MNVSWRRDRDERLTVLSGYIFSTDPYAQREGGEYDRSFPIDTLYGGYQSFKSPPTTPNANAAILICRDNGESARPTYERIVLSDFRKGTKLQT